MEKLIIIALIIVGSIIHSWYQRRREEAESQNESMPPNQPPRPTPAASLEEQLRRLLQGDEPVARPVRPPPARTIPAPPPLPTPTPPVRPTRPHIPAAPRPTLARSAIPIPDEGMEMETGLAVRPVTLHQASTAHVRAQIQASVAQRMRETSARVFEHTGAKRPASLLPPVIRAQEMFRHREYQRSAILASVVLGAPRAFEQ